jgi:hypothetical protein
MTVWDEIYAECQYGFNDKMNVIIKWMIYRKIVRGERYIEFQYGINDILNTST